MILGIWARLSKQASIYPAVQNMLLAARALYLGANSDTLHLQFETESGGRAWPPVRRALICPATDRLTHIGRFGPVHRIALSDVVREDRWGQPCRDL